MVAQVCPACACTIPGTGYKKGGVVYCCEHCATGSQCECGCCTAIPVKSESSKKSVKK